MFTRFVAFGFSQLFGGARRGQPLVTAFGAAVSIWGISKRMNRKEKPMYTRKLKNNETVRIRAFKADAPPQDEL